MGDQDLGVDAAAVDHVRDHLLANAGVFQVNDRVGVELIDCAALVNLGDDDVFVHTRFGHRLDVREAGRGCLRGGHIGVAYRG